MTTGNRTSAIQVVLEFDRSLFGIVAGEGGVVAWNGFVKDLFEMDLLGACWSPGQRPPPLVVMLDLSKMNLSHKRLDGINLAFCLVEDGDFSGSSLKGARLGCCPGSCFRDAKLHGASLGGDLSGCDLTRVEGLEEASFEGAAFDPADPPVGLPDEFLARCRPDPDAVPLTGHTETHIRCCATIHLLPAEDRRWP